MNAEELREFIEERVLYYQKMADYWNDQKRTGDTLYEQGKVTALNEVLAYMRGELK